MGGWWLSDRRNQPYSYKFPPGATIPAGGFLAVDESDFLLGGSNLSFRSVGERCYLFSGDSDGELTGYSHGVLFRGSDRNTSFGRQRSSDGNDYFLTESAPSFGARNPGPEVPPLMITEIMYNPDAGGFPYVELHNTTPDPLRLWEPEEPMRTWGIGSQRPGSEEEHIPLFLFPENTTVPPHGYLICIPQSANVPPDHGIPEGVQGFGVPDIVIPNTRATLRVYRPSGLSGGRIRHVVVDEARYKNLAPWDPSASGGGQALERIGTTPFGADPASWQAGPVGGTPGRAWTGAPPSLPIPELSVSVSGSGQLELRFLAESGYRYSLEESSDLSSWIPTPASPIDGAGSGAVFSRNLEGIRERLYLRVRVETQPPT